MQQEKTGKEKYILKNRKMILSTLWIFVLTNMLYADVLSLMDPTSPIRMVMTGTPMPSGGLIAGAVLMETAIIMILLPHFLSYKLNKWITTFVCALNILAVVVGGHGTYYILFASIEVMCMLFILWLSWQNPDGKGAKGN
ncbi:DUF6326 family protein [Fusibacter ferrireducens]|uniref:DoxX family protein n=1 Tax=Fusibacter ferrireducens TaxID=2785058 RepID=A0ABS0A071_9FIRM|nr:DUF6326 family protein [Fusibacter ferrireducens]MBF4695269.1 hypothetical protein [Fusibacter ferrireducens]